MIAKVATARSTPAFPTGFMVKASQRQPSHECGAISSCLGKADLKFSLERVVSLGRPARAGPLRTQTSGTNGGRHREDDHIEMDLIQVTVRSEYPPQSVSPPSLSGSGTE